MKTLVTIILLLLSFSVNAQFGILVPDNQWNESWITVPGAGENSPGLYLFRKTIVLDAVPDGFKIHISADNRYKLYVNEKLVSLGPALGDIDHWNYETVDLVPYLKKGENIVSACVWNEGVLMPVPQISLRTGFVIKGADEESQVLNTDDSWKCIRDESYMPIPQRVLGYYAAGGGDSVNMQYRVKGWKKPSFDDSTWEQAQLIFGNTSGFFGSGGTNAWNMVPSVLPPMELTLQRLSSVRRTGGISVASSFPEEKASVQVPANTTATILLDQTFLTNAYPTLIFSGGKNSIITITYAEGLYDSLRAKNNRNEIEEKIMLGRQDIIVSDGTINQNFTTLNYRTYRYVELKVETKETPLVIEDFYGTFTGYPFGFNAKLESDIEELHKILEIGWRTARLCAVETYADNPYYERLQYIGDARIQAFISFYNSGDDRLVKNALNLMDYSRQTDGYTLSRYPANIKQLIAPFSLWYICMLHDYMMYGTDPGFINDKLLGTRQIINYFISYTDTDGSLKNVPGWNFTDWADGWQFGVGPFGEDGSSALMDLQMLLGVQSALELEKYAGSETFAALYGNLANRLSQTIKDKYWDESRKLFADTPEKDNFSQHTNSMAILAGLVEGQQASETGRVILSDTSLTEATIYFKYYVHLALTKAGLGDGYLDWLDIWRKNIALGLTTWGETSEVETTRSDCHAWGSSPNIEIFRTILGIESAAPYFKKVRIQPHLGSINKISGEIPHPEGRISVEYDNSEGNLKAEIILPENIEGTFVWKGEVYDLKGGSNSIRL